MFLGFLVLSVLTASITGMTALSSGHSLMIAFAVYWLTGFASFCCLVLLESMRAAAPGGRRKFVRAVRPSLR
jgi:hypothetical protein